MHKYFFAELKGKLSSGSTRKGDSIYLWHGNRDEVVLPLSVHNSYNFLQDFVPEASSIYLDSEVPANHGLSTTQWGILFEFFRILISNFLTGTCKRILF